MSSASPNPSHEETLWRGTPSAKVLVGRVIGLVVLAVGIPAVAAWIARNTPDIDTATRITRVGWFLMILVCVFQLIRLIASLIKIQSTIYTVTNQRILIERGMLSKSLSEIDLRTIDDTQFSQSVTARMLGIGDVTLVSSDKSAPLFVLHNVADPRTLRETIRTHAYQVSQRQLFTRQA